MLRVIRTARSPVGSTSIGLDRKGRMGMWQQLLDRFVPLMDGDASVLDQRDGVGGSAGLVATTHTRTADLPLPAGRGRSAFEGSASPLPS
jgi:hypothetical protein